MGPLEATRSRRQLHGIEVGIVFPARACQGGPLSPLLSHVVLDEFDKELASWDPAQKGVQGESGRLPAPNG